MFLRTGTRKYTQHYSDNINRYDLEISKPCKDLLTLVRDKDLNILFLELGVGANMPAIIKYPFWQMTARNENAVYACINMDMAVTPDEIERQSICIDTGIGIVLSKLTV